MGAWFITFHGGVDSSEGLDASAPSSPAAINTLAGMILSGPLPGMRELRGFTFGSDGNLYIVNAKLHQILQFQPTKSGTFESASVTPWAHKNLHHPFDLEFDGTGNLYVTNQDLAKGATSLQVVMFNASGTFQKVFIPSGAAPGPDLLKLRGIAWDGSSTWYVADEQGSAGGKPVGGGAVYTYNNTGAYLSAISVPDPIQLLFYGGYLFIGSGAGTVYYYDPKATNPAALDLLSKPLPSFPIKGISGLAIPGDGYIYMGNRVEFQVLRFTLDMSSVPSATNGTVFFDQLPDSPEFISLIPT